MKRKYGRKVWNKAGVERLVPSTKPFHELFNEPLTTVQKQETYESPKDYHRLARIASAPDSESVLHESCVDWFDEYIEAHGLDVVLNHTSNQVSGFRGANAKRAGYHKGFPDLSIFHVKKKVRIHPELFGVETREEPVLYAGLFIELKTPKTKNRLSDEQKSTHETLRKAGYKVEVIWDYKTFQQTVIDYLNDN